MVDDAVARAQTASSTPDEAAESPEDASARQNVPASLARFRSCRWHAPQDDGTAEYCSHPEVQPYAGRNGFNAESWCPECEFYKARRSAHRRDADFDY